MKVGHPLGEILASPLVSLIWSRNLTHLRGHVPDRLGVSPEARDSTWLC